MQSLGEFDYVVIGAGSAGCVVAARLSESGQHKVALIEAGGEDDSFWIHAPLGYGKLYDNPKYNWLYDGEPEPELTNHKSYQPRGKVIGGTGSINGMIYMRGCPEDFNHWRQLGNVGWSYDDLLPYFRMSEDNERGASKYHGAGGPMRISNTPRHELADAFIKAGVEAGFKATDDFNGAQFEGFTYNQINTRNGRRESTAVAFLKPARKRSNLKVFINSLATRIVFKNREADSVEFRRDGELCTIKVRREVILSGGAFNSPQLLQASGVGPAALLREHNIPVVVDLPGVGENLQDHFNVSLAYRCTKPITLNDVVHNPLRKFATGLQYILFRTGFMAANASLCGGCIKTDPSFEAPDVKINLQLWHRAGHGRFKEAVGLYPFSAFSTNLMLLRPESRGFVRIQSADTAVAPKMRFNLFVSEVDRRASLIALRAMRNVMQQPAMRPYVAEEVIPGPQVQSDEDMIAFCRERGRSSHHASSTCKMGVDSLAVVDPRLRVHGVGKVRVADASIMPVIVSGNCQASTIMIGEKGAAMALEDAQATARAA